MNKNHGTRLLSASNVLLAGWIALGTLMLVTDGKARGDGFRPQDSKIIGPVDPQRGCVRCHSNEVRAWEDTTHYKTFALLEEAEEAEKIVENLELDDYATDIKLCQDCHVTMYGEDPEPTWGISCEKCHNPAADWLDAHADYGKDASGKKITPETRDAEPAQHKAARIARSIEAGMIRPESLYDLASNCFSCHTVPREELVNKGGHRASSKDFELVAWSQGEVRHNFLHGGENAVASKSRLQALYVTGRLVDLEFSVRGMAAATTDGTFAEAMKERVAGAVAALEAIAEALKGTAHGDSIAKILAVAGAADLGPGKEAALTETADKLHTLGKALAEELASALAAAQDLSNIDPLVPTEYRGEPK